MKEISIASVASLDASTQDTVSALSLGDLQIDELQRDDALGIPELGASLSYYGCSSYGSSL